MGSSTARRPHHPLSSVDSISPLHAQPAQHPCRWGLRCLVLQGECRTGVPVTCLDGQGRRRADRSSECQGEKADGHTPGTSCRCLWMSLYPPVHPPTGPPLRPTALHPSGHTALDLEPRTRVRLPLDPQHKRRLALALLCRTLPQRLRRELPCERPRVVHHPRSRGLRVLCHLGRSWP